VVFWCCGGAVQRLFLAAKNAPRNRSSNGVGASERDLIKLKAHQAAKEYI